MSLIRWSPRMLGMPRDLSTLHDEMDRLFEGFFGGPAIRANGSLSFAPPVDVEENGEEFVVRADLPGVSQKDVKVMLAGDTLTLRGERKAEKRSESAGVHRVERVHGTFERSFSLGTPVRADKVRAQFRDGVLEIHAPKAEEARQREIEVQVA